MGPKQSSFFFFFFFLYTDWRCHALREPFEPTQLCFSKQLFQIGAE